MTFYAWKEFTVPCERPDYLRVCPWLYTTSRDMFCTWANYYYCMVILLPRGTFSLFGTCWDYPLEWMLEWNCVEVWEVITPLFPTELCILEFFRE